MTDNEREGWVGLTGRLLDGLPVSFLGLLAINVAFLACMFWFLHATIESRVELEVALLQGRTTVLTRLMDVCTERLNRD